MDQKTDRKKAAAEWSAIVKAYPTLARGIVAQQLLLIQAVELGDPFIKLMMCKLLRLGLPIPFIDYWKSRCGKAVPVDVDGVIGCLAKAKDPSDCLTIKHEDEWFEDPIAKGRIVPGKPPVPPL